ncbi:MAG TPA: hypothetical protein VE170_03635 [Candidatus Limnocylindria bacterium]|nr:hypothetical protein [Candidatus Limnocylindria bacterium]
MKTANYFAASGFCRLRHRLYADQRLFFSLALSTFVDFYIAAPGSLAHPTLIVGSECKISPPAAGSITAKFV